MEKARLAVVGLGWFGGVLTESARRTGAADVVACFARSPDARAAFAERHGVRAADSYDALLDDPELEGVLLATPHSTHVDMAEQAAAAGKHVFVEKPLALTVEGARRAAEAAERAGVVLQVGHNRRRQPANRRIKEMIHGGELGTLLQVEGFHSAAGGHKPDLPPWRRDPSECPAGGMTALGVHTVDTFHDWVGPAVRVSAFSTKVANLSDLDEATTVMIEYEGGVLGTIGTSYWTAPIVSVAAYGTDAAVWNEEDGARLYVQPRTEGVRAARPVDTIDTIEDELAEFARRIRDGGRPETGGPESVEVAAVLEAILRSAETGTAVDVDALR